MFGKIKKFIDDYEDKRCSKCGHLNEFKCPQCGFKSVIEISRGVWVCGRCGPSEMSWKRESDCQIKIEH